MKTNKKACCFFGHRKIADSVCLKPMVYKAMEDLILHYGVDTFLFGSRSEFDSLCREVASELKEKYPHIKRIYVRAEYPDISDDYKNYLLQSCDETYYPEKLRNAGRAVYVERNFEMIDKSDYCIVYYKKDIIFHNAKSGTEIAYRYAVKNGKLIINLGE